LEVCFVPTQLALTITSAQLDSAFFLPQQQVTLNQLELYSSFEKIWELEVSLESYWYRSSPSGQYGLISNSSVSLFFVLTYFFFAQSSHKHLRMVGSSYSEWSYVFLQSASFFVEMLQAKMLLFGFWS
jgi:hypothetical protein